MASNGKQISASARGSRAKEERKSIGTFFAFLWGRSPFKDSFVAFPLISMILNVALACSLSHITSRDNPALLSQGLRMIGLVSNASISIVTLTFSLTVLSVQIAAQTYSPRLLDEFIKDPVSKIVISVNLGSYVFCYTMLYFIDEESAFPEVPYVAIHFLTIHIGVVLITFISFIHFFINGFRIEQILSRASESSLRAARALSADVNTDMGQDEQPDLPNRSYKVMSDDSGYVTRFQLDQLVSEAETMDICIRYQHQVGEFVSRGTLLCFVWDAKTRKEDLDVPLSERIMKTSWYEDKEAEAENDKPLHIKMEKRLGRFASRGVVISNKRSSDFDVTLGIQQLSDIAVRALSPGVNDPHTAIQCFDVLAPLLATLSTMDFGVPNARDADGNVRLWAPRRSFSHLLAMLDSIRVYGGSDLTVCRRGMRFFGDLGVILTHTNRQDRIPTVQAQLDQWLKVANKNFDTGSPELVSLQDLYNHLLRIMSDSEFMVVKDEEETKDIQGFETTYGENESDEEKMDTISATGNKTAGARLRQAAEDVTIAITGHQEDE